MRKGYRAFLNTRGLKLRYDKKSGMSYAEKRSVGWDGREAKVCLSKLARRKAFRIACVGQRGMMLRYYEKDANVIKERLSEIGISDVEISVISVSEVPRGCDMIDAYQERK